MAPKPTPYTLQLLTRLLAVALVGWLVGCNNTPDNSPATDADFTELQPDIPLPDIGPNPLAPDTPPTIHAIVQRIDVPLDQSTDNAWAVTDELVFPAITRSIWHANGLRLGILGEEDVEPFAQNMPEVLELFETHVRTSTHPLAIMRTPRLRNGVRISMDVTLPPGAPRTETIIGGDDGKLQLLARLEVEGDKTYIIITPHHAVPDPSNLQPRDILERELDGRIYEELSIRVELTADRLLVIGLYWPWPIGEAFEDPEDLAANTPLPELEATWLTQTTGPLADDPAAPPPHLRLGVPDRPESEDQAADTGEDDDTPTQPASIVRTRIAPPLPLHFGRALLTGTRTRKPVQTFLLISIPPAPESEETQPPASEAGDIAEVDVESMP